MTATARDPIRKITTKSGETQPSSPSGPLQTPPPRAAEALVRIRAACAAFPGTCVRPWG